MEASKFLAGANSGNREERIKSIVLAVKDHIRSNDQENANNLLQSLKTDDDFVLQASLLVVGIVLGLADRFKGNNAKEFASIIDYQGQQIVEITQFFTKLSLNEENKSLVQLRKEFLPTLHPYATRFSEMAKNTADFFEQYPGWQSTITNSDAAGLKEILQNGISMDTIYFMLKQRHISDLAENVLTATLNLHQTGTLCEHAVTDSVIDGINLAERMNIAANKENYTLAALFRDVIGGKQKG